MNKKRPKNLNLFTIHQPLPAIISILHRLSGFALFLLIPILLCGLQYSLTESGFSSFQGWLALSWVKFLFWIFFIPYIFHLIAGLRHLLMDIHVGETLRGGRLSALLTLIISILLIILAGVWLW